MAKKATSSGNAWDSSILFEADELIVGPTVVQPYDNPNDLFAAAGLAQSAFIEMMSGVTDACSGQILVEEPLTTILAALGPAAGHKTVVVVAPLKGMKRAREKVEATTHKRWNMLRDVVRGTISVRSISQLSDVVKILRETLFQLGWSIVPPVRNRMETPTPAGYRDIQIVLCHEETGFLCELQLTSHTFFITKEQTCHRLYEIIRTIEAEAAIRGTGLTTTETAKIEDANAEMIKQYDKAWNDSKNIDG